MEIMEDGNLVDRVRILLQRDMKYYQEKQTVLRESICARVSGGRLDFPRHASFAAIKIVTWWEAEFTAAFNRSSGLGSTTTEMSTLTNDDEVVKQTNPSEFVSMVVDTSDQLLEHLHTLTQEALDHADLTVLTATLGAAALIRNSLWSYNQQVKSRVSPESCAKLRKCFKSYQEIADALAERLLDLHCRLISLYVLNEADSMDWHSNEPFFEKERCSFVIHMWWLYMQGTKQDLWNTVPPKLAQRVFSGMLDESLTILTARFLHGRPSLARCEQFWADVFNVLRCTAELSLATFTSGSEMLGFQMSRLPIISRDIHAKCGELFVALLIRGIPLNILFQVFRDGFEDSEMSKPRRGPAAWLVVSTPRLISSLYNDVDNVKLLPDDLAIELEIKVMTAQPQPDWQQLLKTLSMRRYKVSALLFEEFTKQSRGFEANDSFTKREGNKANKEENEGCGGFLCPGDSCRQPPSIAPLWLYSLTYVCVSTDMNANVVVVPSLIRRANWANCLDREQVWNQIRPAWLHGMLTPLYPMMTPVISTLIDAVKTGATTYQAMSLALACFEEEYVCLPLGLLRTARALNENIPAHCHPIGGSVTLQLLCASLYTELLKLNDETTNIVNATIPSSDKDRNDVVAPRKHDRRDATELAIALAEAICSIDEDDKHTLQIESLLREINARIDSDEFDPREVDVEGRPSIAENFADQLLFTAEGRLAIKVIYEYVIYGSEWILDSLGVERAKCPMTAPIFIPHTEGMPVISKPLLHLVFHIGSNTFDQLLMGYVREKWLSILRIPQSISTERIRAQLLKRPEFKDVSHLQPVDKEATEALKLLCNPPNRSRWHS